MRVESRGSRVSRGTLLPLPPLLSGGAGGSRFKRIDGPSSYVKDAERLAKKKREAMMLRDLGPAETLAMGFDLIEFARAFAGAADRASR